MTLVSKMGYLFIFFFMYLLFPLLLLIAVLRHAQKYLIYMMTALW